MSKSLDRLTLLETFVRIAEAGSISAAARDLGLSQPSASRQLAELESRLQAQLVRRNTHSLALTEAGIDLLGDARQIVDSWEVLQEKHVSDEEQVKGRLKVVAPVALGQTHLAKMVCKFQRQHPQVSIVWELQDHAIRFAETGCDCWVKVGPVPDDGLIVRLLGSVERLLVASKPSIDRHGMPKTPKQAGRLNLVALEPFEGGRIPLTDQTGRSSVLRPPLQMKTNNIAALKQAALIGLGMAVMPRWFIDEELGKNRLIDLLPRWRAPSLGIHVAYLPGRHQPRRLRAFLEMLTEQVRRIPGINTPET